MTMNTLETKIRSKLKRGILFNIYLYLICLSNNNNLIVSRESINSYINDEYVEGTEDLINFCILNDITKPELQYFIGKYFKLFLINILK